MELLRGRRALLAVTLVLSATWFAVPIAATKTFAVYTLSRGKGVPPEAREAQQKVQAMVDADRKRGVKVSAETTRIGIEGERRLCVTYENTRDGARALERARAIVKGVDLVRLVEEPCSPSPKSPSKERLQ